VSRANRGYLQAYARNAQLMGVLEHVAMVDPELRDIRRGVRLFWVERAEQRICRWQAEGLARADVDAHYAANALGAMVDRCAFLWFVGGEPFEEDRAVASLTDLYVHALGLPVPSNSETCDSAPAASL
jgi:hypothetical protein